MSECSDLGLFGHREKDEDALKRKTHLGVQGEFVSARFFQSPRQRQSQLRQRTCGDPACQTSENSNRCPANRLRMKRACARGYQLSARASTAPKTAGVEPNFSSFCKETHEKSFGTRPKRKTLLCRRANSLLPHFLAPYRSIIIQK